MLNMFPRSHLHRKTLFSFDAEFVDTGNSVELISIGLVRQDGAELYLENGNFLERSGHLLDDWMNQHVMGKTFMITAPDDDRIVPHADMAGLVSRFLLADGSSPSIWAHYAPYDYVAFAQLFGRVIDIPDGLPRFAMDFRVMQELTGIKPPSQSPENSHHALIDARWGKLAFASFGIPFQAYDPVRDRALPEPSASNDPAPA